MHRTLWCLPIRLPALCLALPLWVAGCDEPELPPMRDDPTAEDEASATPPPGVKPPAAGSAQPVGVARENTGPAREPTEGVSDTSGTDAVPADAASAKAGPDTPPVIAAAPAAPKVSSQPRELRPQPRPVRIPRPGTSVSQEPLPSESLTDAQREALAAAQRHVCVAGESEVLALLARPEKLQVLDLQHQRILRSYPIKADQIADLDLQARHNRVALALLGDNVRVWEVEDVADHDLYAQQQRLMSELGTTSLKLQGGSVERVALHPTKDILATINARGHACLWHVPFPPTRDLAVSISESAHFRAAADGAVILQVENRSVTLWTRQLGRYQSRTLRVADEPVSCWDLSRDGVLAAVTGESGRLIVLRTSDGTPLLNFDTKRSEIRQVRFSADGRSLYMVTAGDRPQLLRWTLPQDSDSVGTFYVPPVSVVAPGKLTVVSALPPAAGGDSTAESDKTPDALEDGGSASAEIALRPVTKVLVKQESGRLELLDASGTPIHSYLPAEETRWIADGAHLVRLTGTETPTAEVLSVLSAETLGSVTLDSEVAHASVSADGRFLAVADAEGRIAIREVDTGLLVQSVDHGAPLLLLSFVADSQSSAMHVQSLSADRCLETPVPLLRSRQLATDSAGGLGLTFDSDGSSVIVWDDAGTIHRWFPDDVDRNVVWSLPEAPVTDVVHLGNPDRLISAHRDGSIALWSEEASAFPEPSETPAGGLAPTARTAVGGAAATPSSRRGRATGNAPLTGAGDPASPAALRRRLQAGSPVTSLAVLENGSSILAGTWSAGIIRWDISRDRPEQLSRSWKLPIVDVHRASEPDSVFALGHEGQIWMAAGPQQLAQAAARPLPIPRRRMVASSTTGLTEIDIDEFQPSLPGALQSIEKASADEETRAYALALRTAATAETRSAVQHATGAKLQAAGSTASVGISESTTAPDIMSAPSRPKRIWTVETGELPADPDQDLRLTADRDLLTVAAYYGSGVAGEEQWHLRVWDVDSGVELRHWIEDRAPTAASKPVARTVPRAVSRDGGNPAETLHLSPDARYAWLARPGRGLVRFELGTGERRVLECDLASACFSSGGSFVLVGVRGEEARTSAVLNRVDTESMQITATAHGFDAVVPVLTLSPDDAVCVAAIREPQHVRLVALDPSTLQEQSLIDSQEVDQPWRTATVRGGKMTGVQHLMFTPNGRSLLAYGNRSINEYSMKVWNLRAAGNFVPRNERYAEHSVKRSMVDPNITDPGLSFVNSATLIAVIAPDEVEVVDLNTGKTLRTVSRETTNPRRLHEAFSADGMWYAQADASGQVRLANLKSDASPTEIAAHVGPVLQLRFSHDGKSLLTIGVDHTIHAWQFLP